MGERESSWVGTEFDMSRTHHESKVAGGRPRREEVQGRIGIWNKEKRNIIDFRRGMKEVGQACEGGRSRGTQMTCLEE